MKATLVAFVFCRCRVLSTATRSVGIREAVKRGSLPRATVVGQKTQQRLAAYFAETTTTSTRE